MLQLENLAQYVEGIDEWIEACEAAATSALRGLAILSFNYILEGTPEWSGNLAANWKMSVMTPNYQYDDIFKDQSLGKVIPEPYSKVSPNEAALNYARANARDAVAAIRLYTPVFITNATPYAYEVEVNESGGKPFLRGINLPVEMIHAANEKFGMGEVDFGALTGAQL